MSDICRRRIDTWEGGEGGEGGEGQRKGMVKGRERGEEGRVGETVKIGNEEGMKKKGRKGDREKMHFIEPLI